ncbi:MAG: hypothetical protein ACLT98_16030 [Eggerthellaceae bacterium]
MSADEVDELDARLGERDAVARPSSYRRSGQCTLERANDNRRLAAAATAVQALSRQLLGDEREHRGTVRRTEIAHELFGTFLQLVGRATSTRRTGLRTARCCGRDDVAARRSPCSSALNTDRPSRTARA